LRTRQLLVAIVEEDENVVAEEKAERQAEAERDVAARIEQERWHAEAVKNVQEYKAAQKNRRLERDLGEVRKKLKSAAPAQIVD